ncbi:MAG: TRAP transporter large permease subunit [Myxococcales bacterium]|nr:MAG: TRAP transporter large permease subunit [Myxococcales bacterium]
MTDRPRERWLPFIIIVALVLFLPFLGKGGLLAAAIIAAALVGAPLFVLIGIGTLGSLFLWSHFRDINQFTIIIEGIRSLADSPTLLAIPFFIMSGAVMSRGQISQRLIDFAQALIGWVPGGMAMSGVIACMLFAAISGSSPATVVAIGSMMGPALIAAGYQERFSHGLLTSAGSLGILIPPSIPMIVYPIVNQGAVIEVERLFASGFGPGLVMGSILIGYSFYHGIRDKVPTEAFRFKKLAAATRDGFWALMFPILILGGIYGGIFNAVEASAISVVYAVVVEVWLHRALKLKDTPRIFGEVGVFLGSFLVILVMALALGEFLEKEDIPALMVEWIQSKDLAYWQFLLLLNVMLLAVGMMMDILSAMFVFVPLLAPIAASMGIDPMHFGIIFIVNLEIGYLTPPVGLNLFVASALYEKGLGHIIRSVAPFVGLMLIGLALITWYPQLSIGLGNAIMGGDPNQMIDEDGDAEGDEDAGGMPTMEEMMQEAMAGEDSWEDEEEEDEEEDEDEAFPEEDEAELEETE